MQIPGAVPRSGISIAVSLYRSFAPPSLALSCAMPLLVRAVVLLPRLSVSSLGWAAVPLGGGPCPPSARVRGGIASNGQGAGGPHMCKPIC